LRGVWILATWVWRAGLELAALDVGGEARSCCRPTSQHTRPNSRRSAGSASRAIRKVLVVSTAPRDYSDLLRVLAYVAKLSKLLVEFRSGGLSQFLKARLHGWKFE
jgi:hypothetical protein